MDTQIDPALAVVLDTVIDPELRRPITELGMVESARIIEHRAEATVKLTIVGCPASDRIRAETTQALERVVGTGMANVTLSVMNDAERQELKRKLGVGQRANPFGKGSLTRIVLITSGKGGVGKSTIAANLAVALSKTGLKVGLVDADVYGFSIPGQLGVTEQPTQIDGMMVPPIAFGVRVVSIGMFVGSAKAVSWRGPMLHRTLKQFLTDTYFGDLDMLLVDLPPGTGDVAISAGQLMPDAEVVVVTTPQDAAADVAFRSGIVGAQTGQRVVGVVENMAWLPLPDGSTTYLFGSGGGAKAAAALTDELGYTVPVLGEIPISQALRESADAGSPFVLTPDTDAEHDDPARSALLALAERLSRRASSGSHSLPLSVR